MKLSHKCFSLLLGIAISINFLQPLMAMAGDNCADTTALVIKASKRKKTQTGEIKFDEPKFQLNTVRYPLLLQPQSQGETAAKSSIAGDKSPGVYIRGALINSALWDSWKTRIENEIFSIYNWVSEKTFANSKRLTALVSYSVDQKGMINGVRVIRSSGNNAFDTLILNSVNSVSEHPNLALPDAKVVEPVTCISAFASN